MSKNIEEWMRPLITVNDDGERVYEWWHARRKLTVYVGESVEYVLVTGNDITDGDITCEADIRRVCAWIMQEEAV